MNKTEAYMNASKVKKKNKDTHLTDLQTHGMTLFLAEPEPQNWKTFWYSHGEGFQLYQENQTLFPKTVSPVGEGPFWGLI